MQSRSLEILVGIFLCLGVAAIFVLTFRVASLNSAAGGDYYTVTAKFDDIGSLATGASVKLAGVRIGQVSRIAIDPKSFQAVVTLEINDRYNSIPSDSSAKILTQGLLGAQYVGIEPGGSLKNLKNGSQIILTQSAFVLENVLGQFLVNMAQKGGSNSSSPASGPASGGSASVPH